VSVYLGFAAWSRQQVCPTLITRNCRASHARWIQCADGFVFCRVTTLTTVRGECQQLLGEITRGSWGICMAQGGDVHAAPPQSQPGGGPASRTESRESDSEGAGVESEQGQVGHQAAGGLRAEVEDHSGSRSVGENSDQESGEEADIASSISGLGAAQVSPPPLCCCPYPWPYCRRVRENRGEVSGFTKVFLRETPEGGRRGFR